MEEKGTMQDEILDGSTENLEAEESETSEETSASKSEQEKTGEVGKTQGEGSSQTQEPDVEQDIESALKSGADIPYKRFKNFVDNWRNKGKKTYEEKMSALEAELEENRGYINNPDVFRAILQSKGITDKKIQNQKLKEAGFEVGEGTLDDDSEGEIKKKLNQLKEGLDLNTQEGWAMYNWRISRLASNQALTPVQQKLSQKETQEWVKTQEDEARKLSKEVFNLEYGQTRKDERNPNTAVGKIWAYLQKHPNHAGLGHVTLLRLAMSEDGFKLGKQQGIDEAKQRNEDLKKSQMEDDSVITNESEPSGNESAETLMKWYRKHHR